MREIGHHNDTLYLATQNSIGIFNLRTETCSTMRFDEIDISKRELPDLAIVDIEFQVGFGSTNYYINQFHKLYGISPAQYRIQG